MDCGTLWYVTIDKIKKKEKEWIEQMVNDIARVAESGSEKDWPDWIKEWVNDLPDQKPSIYVEGKKLVSMSSGDTGEDIRLHVAFLRKFIEKWRPENSAIMLEYSNVTSRGAEFGGGVYVISSEYVVTVTTQEWAWDQMDQLDLEEL